MAGTASSGPVGSQCHLLSVVTPSHTLQMLLQCWAALDGYYSLSLLLSILISFTASTLPLLKRSENAEMPTAEILENKL